MLLFIIFIISLNFFIFVQENTIDLCVYKNPYTQDQLKSIAGFIRNQETFSSTQIEFELGISSSFFENIIQIKELPKQCLAFDSFIIQTQYLFNSKSQTIPTFLDQNFIILINKIQLTSYDILYYSQFLMNNKNLSKQKIISIFPNITARVQNYIL